MKDGSHVSRNLKQETGAPAPVEPTDIVLIYDRDLNLR